MNHVVICMGETKEAYFREAFLEYRKRMNTFGSLAEIFLKPAKTPGRDLSADEIRLTLEKEGAEFERILSQPKYQKSYRVALCIEGKGLSSEELSELYRKIAVGGKNSIVYLIGSSWGLSEKVKAACDLRLSFSRMTFAHSLFHVMLAEQIYRAESIGAGNKYHK